MTRKRPLRVALTGGIASGKSTVAELFAARGIPIIDTDQIAHEVVAPGRPGLRRIVEAFGGRITAANAPEGGAVFTIRLPRLGDQRKEAAE